ncbi:MAG: glycosyltransferase [Kiritimatiellae bacterium]|nr:glycosyltransferase [Kiritimatiellia bacterium]
MSTELHYPKEWSDLNVVLCHDWLTGMRGGERVLEILCQAFPSAPIYTLLYNRDAVSETINAHAVHTSFLQRVPGITKSYRNFLPLFPAAIRHMMPPEADLIISTSHCVAKSLRPTGKTRHLCYCFTPMRYAWCFYEEYFGSNSLKAVIAKPILSALRRWDRTTASRVDRFVSISQHVQDRLRMAYGRESDIVFPPVDVHRCTPDETTTSECSFDLVVSALVPYKRVDLAVEAYSRLGYPLKVVGTGTEFDHLRKKAAGNVEFLGWQTDESVLELYRSCRMLIFPGEEDFGIVPLEAQACGKPVVAFRKGGATETVNDGVSGVFFDEQSVESLAQAVEACASTTWNPRAVRQHAEQFGPQQFIDGLTRSVTACLQSEHHA